LGFVSVAALCMIRYDGVVLKSVTYILLSLLSIFFNLSSRTYSLGSIIIVLVILLSSKPNRKKAYQALPFVLFFAILMTILLYIFSPLVSGQNFVFGIQRSFERSVDADDPFTRIYTSSIAPLVESFSVAPLFGGAGLGSTANFSDSSLKDVLFESYQSCWGYLEEGEVSRIICSFGVFGLLTVLFFRFFPSLVLFQASQTDKDISQNYNPFLFIASLLYAFNFLPLKANDIFSGLLAFLLISKAVRQLIIPKAPPPQHNVN
jgi:hypothetical protein